MIIEIIADSLSDAKIAEEAGANRIELITGALEGGLTPSYGLIESVCSSVTIPVNVMIRPHARGFCYTDEEINIMARDIKVCKDLGASGVVLGTLTQNRQINEDALSFLIDAAKGLDVTFHRAFDEVNDQIEALKMIQKHPEVSRILTSGGKDKAIDAVEQFQELVRHTEDSSLSILAGSGLTPSNIVMFLDKVKVKEIHFGSAVRFQSSFSQSIDPLKIKEIRDFVSTKNIRYPY
ncbi:copper homeostasis protein CutC [Heyndrickxia sp. NPDC080065]|uniref:copper homeostasis protein CutC n=1 Tax=Heyndrickxia sp. NPDC080065 TaxID=3390568 RepID=UPI003D05AB36